MHLHGHLLWQGSWHMHSPNGSTASADVVTSAPNTSLPKLWQRIKPLPPTQFQLCGQKGRHMHEAAAVAQSICTLVHKHRSSCVPSLTSGLPLTRSRKQAALPTSCLLRPIRPCRSALPVVCLLQGAPPLRPIGHPFMATADWSPTGRKNQQRSLCGVAGPPHFPPWPLLLPPWRTLASTPLWDGS